MSTIAFVPARGGSKGIPGKNIKTFCGEPLIYWCLAELEVAKTIDQVVVATDSLEIESIVKSFNFSKVNIYQRSKENALDHSSTESVILEYINASQLSAETKFVLVQATSPLTKANHFDEANKVLSDSNCDSLLTCARIKRFFWEKNGNSINYDYRNRPRRQDFEGTLIENGAFYINSVGNILQSGNRLSGKICTFEMPEYTTLELDEEEDWLLGEFLMKKHQKPLLKSGEIKLFLSDIDGVLTDAGMYYSENGDELKKFSTYDGMGFKLLKNSGIKTGLVTSEDRLLNKRRFEKLELDFLYQGVNKKLEVVKALCKELDIDLKNVAYIGDDINDLELLQNVGVAACPANARKPIKQIPNIIHLSTSGGSGAVREFVEHILK